MTYFIDLALCIYQIKINPIITQKGFANLAPSVDLYSPTDLLLFNLFLFKLKYSIGQKNV